MLTDILIIDDEKDIRDLVCEILNEEHYTTRVASSASEALEQINEKVPTVIVLDIWLQGSELDGIGILEIIKKNFSYLPVIMISGHGTIETAVKSIRNGAFDYIEKPFTSDQLLHRIKKACEAAKIVKENLELRSKIIIENDLIGDSKSIVQLKSLINKIASANSRVLINGHSGSGKKLVAKLIHQKSKRKNEPFLVLDAFGMNEEKLEIELWGEDNYKKFSDTPRKIGILELANNGTLYIDEIGELPISAQNKILHFLQDQTIIRVGNNKPIKLDVRIIASTSRNLIDEISQSRFKKDLYYRLNVISIEVPPLSKRKEDIPLLCDYFCKNIAQYAGLKFKKLSQEAMIILQTYSWPGNVRELKNIMERLLILAEMDNNTEILANLLPPEIINQEDIVNTEFEKNIMLLPLKEAREAFEKKYLRAQAKIFNNNITKIAKHIGMERSALHRKLKALNIINNEN